MNEHPHITAHALFEHAPPCNMLTWLGLSGGGWSATRLRVFLVACVGWVPLIMLVAIQSPWMDADALPSLLREIGVYARYLVAAPLFVAAELLCAPRLSDVILQFTRRSIVVGEDRHQLSQECDRTRRLLQSPAVELVVLLLAYAAAIATTLSHSPAQLPAWARRTDLLPLLSLAGWWHMLVSLPLLIVLLFGWLWRLVLWARLLWTISGMNLRLLVSHPDHCAGLSFVGHSIRTTAIIGTALAFVIAGRSAHAILENHAIPTPFLYFNIGFLTTIALLLIAPVLVFVGPLQDAWLRGTREYGALADRIGRAFEQKWLDPNKPADSSPIPDLSTMSDLTTIVTNVNDLRSIPIDARDLLVLAAALLLPFLPLVFLAFPLDLIWQQLKNLLV